MSQGFGAGRGYVPSAFAASEFEVHPLLIVPGLVRGLQADGGGNNTERAVAHDEPLVLRLYQLYKSAGAPHRGDAESRPRNFRGSNQC